MKNLWVNFKNIWIDKTLRDIKKDHAKARRTKARLGVNPGEDIMSPH